jgi:imidazolonepropionase-like amidohydrolase
MGASLGGRLLRVPATNGNPLENINLIADPAKNFKIIMKDGKVYKNTLGG